MIYLEYQSKPYPLRITVDPLETQEEKNARFFSNEFNNNYMIQVDRLFVLLVILLWT